MWKYVGKLDDDAYLWKHKTSGQWFITYNRKDKPIGDDGYYMLSNLLAMWGI
jgi:hypothetical protein